MRFQWNLELVSPDAHATLYTMELWARRSSANSITMKMEFGSEEVRANEASLCALTNISL